MKLTYFVHSITNDNESDIATGWLPGSLSETGIRLARELHSKLEKRDFDAVFCFDSHRAVQSTELFFDRKFPVFIDWRLRKCNYGAYDGKPAHEFKKDLEHNYISLPYPNGESYEDVEFRIRSFLNDLEQMEYDSIAVVSHQAPQLALNVILDGLSWETAITADWRKTGSWQAGWEYSL